MSNHKEDRLPGWRVNVLAGMTQATLVTITGYPLDLFKSRMQSFPEYASVWACAKDVFAKKGAIGLYRGASMPFISHMTKRPTQLSISEYLKSKYSNSNGGNGINSGSHSNLSTNYIIGASCGITGAIFGTPLQVIKVGMQTSDSGTTLQYAKKEFAMNGIKGLYRGFIPTLTKDVSFGASFIGSYYSLRDIVGTNTWYKNFFNGSVAHCITWCLLIPIDYVKTNIQRDQTGSKTVAKVIQEGFAKGGIRVFWKGILPACAKTLPVSGVAMTGYELVRKHLS